MLAVAVFAGSTAGASITPSANANDYAQAIASDPSLVTGGAFVTKPPQGTPDAISTSSLAGFPTDGSNYAILTTGDATHADSANSSGSFSANDGGGNVRGSSDFDVTVLKVNLNVPQGANCLSFDFRFLTEEYPEYVGQAFNDAFIAELDTSDWKTTDSNINAPHNFAFDPAHNPITVNATGGTSVSAANAAGTTYDGATPLLAAVTPVTPGHHVLYLSIFDQGDQDLDSAVFVDNLAAGKTASGVCKKGATTGGGVGGGSSNKPFPVVSGPVTGTVLIKLPGTNTFVPLKPGAPVPNGSEIDATHGTVRLPAPGGSDVFYAGAFFVYSTFETTRSPAGLMAKQQVVEMRLAGGNFGSCGTRSPAGVSDNKPVRSLWGHGKGHFKTKGKYGSATVRGTFWLTQDRCDGTFFRVKQGKVEVLDFVKHKKILLTPGKTYLAAKKH